MKKAAVLIALLFGLVVAGIAFANNGPAKIDFPGGKKGVVHFEHAKHQASETCGDCHHGEGHSEYKEGMAIGKCVTCHEGKKVKKAFHTNCKGCHKEKGAGPTKCNDCHHK